jgi:hypothetical protein
MEDGSYMKVNIFRRMGNGRGIIRTIKSIISATRSRNTCGMLVGLWQDRAA